MAEQETAQKDEFDKLLDDVRGLGVNGRELCDRIDKQLLRAYYKGVEDFAKIVSLSMDEQSKGAVKALMAAYVEKHRAELQRLVEEDG